MSENTAERDEELDIIEDEADQFTDVPLIVRIAAELAGTFILVFIGLGVLLYASISGAPDPFTIAIAFGVALAAAIALFAGVSGAHVNPAVTLGAAIKGQLRWVDVPAYWVAQLAGGTAAAGLLFLTVPDGLPRAEIFGTTVNGFEAEAGIGALSGGQFTFSFGQALALEAVATGILVAVCLGTASWVKNAVVPVVAGLTLTGLLLVLGPVTGGALNPVRATAAAIFTGGESINQLWLFWVAPLLGGAIAGLSYAFFAPRPIEDEDEEAEWEEDEDEDDEWDDDAEDSVEAEHRRAEEAGHVRHIEDDSTR